MSVLLRHSTLSVPFLSQNKLLLTDNSVQVTREHSAALGMGFRCGFLGLLHLDVFQQRLHNEFDVSVIVTSPTVPYRIVLASGEERHVDNALHFPTTVKV